MSDLHSPARTTYAPISPPLHRKGMSDPHTPTPTQQTSAAPRLHVKKLKAIPTSERVMDYYHHLHGPAEEERPSYSAVDQGVHELLWAYAAQWATAVLPPDLTPELRTNIIDATPAACFYAKQLGLPDEATAAVYDTASHTAALCCRDALQLAGIERHVAALYTGRGWGPVRRSGRTSTVDQALLPSLLAFLEAATGRARMVERDTPSPTPPQPLTDSQRRWISAIDTHHRAAGAEYGRDARYQDPRKTANLQLVSVARAKVQAVCGSIAHHPDHHRLHVGSDHSALIPQCDQAAPGI